MTWVKLHMSSPASDVETLAAEKHRFREEVNA